LQNVDDEGNVGEDSVWSDVVSPRDSHHAPDRHYDGGSGSVSSQYFRENRRTGDLVNAPRKIQIAQPHTQLQLMQFSDELLA
jgi:hypothetical protein